ncbi:MAG: polyprenyl synthetase family protein [Eubacteriales bacterium]|nr:polyprenyl synthetase family protein [Eubacteriales bacterium]
MLSEQLSEYSRLTERKLSELIDEASCAPILNRSMLYSVFSGGKRVRPALCIASCELCGGIAEDALLAACAVELIHTYSLIHDDLPAMDNDDMRRGKPSSHKAFGEANAILAGDGLQALAFLALAKYDCKDALEYISRGALQMVIGQSLDVNAEGGVDLLEALQDYKTGALFRAAVLSGAACAHANAAQREALIRFANAYGMLFQITDDILDSTGDAVLLGKTVGKDAAEGKLTFVTAYGVESAKTHAQSYAKIALDAVKTVNTDAAFFTELIQYTLARKS